MWALPVPLVLLQGMGGGGGGCEEEDSPTIIPVPSPIINSHSVARVLQGLATPLCSAREWRTSSSSEVGSLWGRWVGFDFAQVERVAARVVRAYGGR